MAPEPAEPAGPAGPADASLIRLIVPEGLAGQSLAALVVGELGPAAAAPVLVHAGVWLGRARVWDVTQPAPAGAEVIIHRPPTGRYAELAITAADICYEDGGLLALNKRAGWYVTPTPWDAYGNVRVALQFWLDARAQARAYLHLVHQLDRDTSGVLLCSRDQALNGLLQVAFNSGAVEKEYLCICQGEPAEDGFVVRSGHGRGRGGGWRLYALEEVGRRLPNGTSVKYAHTSFAVVRRLGGAALLRAHLHTGRTHQIRLHLAGQGHPLLGDAKYGGALMFRGEPVPHHLLHAAVMRLEHPATGAPLELRAPLPPVLARFGGV